MKLKRYLSITVFLIAPAIILPIYSQQHLQPHSGFQISTLGALDAGVYEGAATLAELKLENCSHYISQNNRPGSGGLNMGLKGLSFFGSHDKRRLQAIHFPLSS